MSGRFLFARLFPAGLAVGPAGAPGQSTPRSGGEGAGRPGAAGSAHTRVHRVLRLSPVTVKAPEPAGRKRLSPFFTAIVSPPQATVPSPSTTSRETKLFSQASSDQLPSWTSTVKYSHWPRWGPKSWGAG